MFYGVYCYASSMHAVLLQKANIAVGMKSLLLRPSGVTRVQVEFSNIHVALWSMCSVTFFYIAISMPTARKEKGYPDLAM